MRGWRYVEPYERRPKMEAEKWLVVARRECLRGERTETVVQAPDGTFWQFSDCVGNVMAYRVERWDGKTPRVTTEDVKYDHYLELSEPYPF